MEIISYNQVNIEDEMKRSYLDYAMSVIIGRALPDVRDGLKPVHRRVLWAMHELGNTHNKPYKKSARVVGECLGKYHPHGDMAVYETIVRMAQDFSMRYPLIDGQGNFGSIDGDAAAAQRYTEVRMSRIAEELLADIEKETVDFQPNYDNSLLEPKVLPARFPNLLVNGSEGIAVGMATKIPPHNLSEIIDATIELIKNPNITIDELIKYIPGPDFPTGGFIYGREEIYKAYREGRGVIQLRARAAIDRIGRGSSERDAIVITEIPYQVNKAKLIEKIAELVQERKLEDIAEIRDESNREGMRIVLELKRSAVPQVILNKLYKLTPMQSSFGIINLALVNGQPKILNLKQLLEAFVNFRREVVKRRTEYELKKARARAHILEGLNKAIDALDYIIPLIRNSRSTEEAKNWLTADFSTLYEVRNWRGIPQNKTLAGFLRELQKKISELGFSEAQAQAILDLQLRRLSQLERQKIIDELEGLLKQISEYEAILSSEKLLRQVIIKELQEVKKQFGDTRRTQIVDAGVEIKIEDLIPDENVVITVTKMGYVKRTPVSSYSRQARGGKGRFGAKAKNDDFVEHLFIASTHAYLMIFTDDGQVYKIKVHEIPEAEPSARGKAIVNLVAIPSDRKVVSVVAVRDFPEDKYLTFVTKQGIIKKTSLSEYQNIRSTGINAINIDEGDELIKVIETDGKKQIFIATKDGMAVRFNEDEVRPMGRSARGVRGISLREGDFVVSACALSTEGEEKILSISEKGYGKQTHVENYRLTKRGAYGVINMKTTEKTGKVVAAFPVDENSEVMIITKQGKLVRLGVDKIRETGRSAQGVTLIRTDDDDVVTSASVLKEEEEEEEE
ncbi:MAG: DNA gyrase subunit A [Pyrinomonadaceae bacterium]|nr:DNA gyrase subunit A [Pyrinomonadaceae bacterium]